MAEFEPVLLTNIHRRDSYALRAYERARKAHNLAIDGAMSAFDRVFRTRSRAVAGLRNAGFGVTDRLAPLKRVFMRHASGLDGDLPRAARTGRAPGMDEGPARLPAGAGYGEDGRSQGR